MTRVTAQMSVSLDGYYAGPRSTTDPHDMAAFMEGPEGPGFFRVTRWVIDAMGWRERQGFAGGERSVNSTIIEETFAAAGAYVMGRRTSQGSRRRQGRRRRRWGHATATGSGGRAAG